MAGQPGPFLSIILERLSAEKDSARESLWKILKFKLTDWPDSINIDPIRTESNRTGINR